MDYSLSKRKMSVGPHTGKEVFVASAVCQKHHITFDELCERMADDSTVGQADIAAVFYRFRKVLNQLCSQGSSLTAVRSVHSAQHHLESSAERGGFQAGRMHHKDADSLHPIHRIPQTEDVEFFRVAVQEKKKGKDDKKKKEETGGTP